MVDENTDISNDENTLNVDKVVTGVKFVENTSALNTIDDQSISLAVLNSTEVLNNSSVKHVS